MKKIEFEEHKQLELAILEDLHKFCVKNNLTYFLTYGTLLGAVRHHGFIPWDDDIDVMMPRKDYNRLMEIYNENPHNQYYELINPYDKKARHSFIKIIDKRTIKIETNVDYSDGSLGVDIDIFPIDGAPSDDLEYDKWFEKLYKNYKMFVYCILDPKAKLKLRVIPLFRFLCGGKSRRLKIAEKLHNKYPYNVCEYAAIIECCYDLKSSRVKKSYYEKAILMDFENQKFYVPAEYDYLLTKMYGDYMTPPENRETHHSNIVYWK